MSEKTPNLKFYADLESFGMEIGLTGTGVQALITRGVIPGDIVAKSGKKQYVHVAKARAALKSAPISPRGRIPAWVEAVGNKAGIAKRAASVARRTARAAGEVAKDA